VKVLYILLAGLSLPVTHILSNLFWQGLREARGIATLVDSEILQRIVTESVLNDPPAKVARFARPLNGSYAMSMKAFQHADREAHSRARAILRSGLAVTVLASGVLGFLALGWLGLAFPVVNVLIVQTTFLGSTQGSFIDEESTARAAEHVQILAVILDRWYRNSPHEVTEWLKATPQMTPLWSHLRALKIRRSDREHETQLRTETLGATVQKFRDFYKSLLNEGGEQLLREWLSRERDLSNRLSEEERRLFLAMITQLESELLGKAS
jgi:hypothetical protein